MARHCMRPGCDRAAAARLTYDTVAAAVWLDRPADDGEPAQQVCSIHAATLTAPLGWTVTDRRLLSVGSVPTGDADDLEHATAVEGPVEDAGAGEGLAGEDVAVHGLVGNGSAGEVSEDPALDPGVAAADADRGESTEGTRPRGKLLDRAFEWTGPQHSVLTTGPDSRRRRN